MKVKVLVIKQEVTLIEGTKGFTSLFERSRDSKCLSVLMVACLSTMLCQLFQDLYLQVLQML